jgi:pimeloyl-ACP methyl ester carboxylesterase
MRSLAVLVVGLMVALPTGASAARDYQYLHAKTRHVRVGDITMGYRTLGQGRPLLLVCGTGCTMDDWDPAWVDRVAVEHRVVLFDNRGVRSTTRGSKRLTVRVYADDAAALISALKLHRPDVYGNSLGGFITEDLAVFHPNVVRRVVIASAVPGGHLSLPPTSQAIQILLTAPNGNDPAALFYIEYSPDCAGRAAAHSYLHRVHLRPGFHDVGPSVTQAQVRADAEFYTDAEGAYPLLPHVHIPVWVVAGRDDPLVPAKNARIIASRIPHAKLGVFPGRHEFANQYADRFIPRLLSFLR